MGLIDRDKVIKGLECCSSLDSNCAECPYNYDGEGGESPCLREKLIPDALELLKEQEAVPVIQREVIHMLFWCCGSCGVPITSGDKFCRMCGKTVKWK